MGTTVVGVLGIARVFIARLLLAPLLAPHILLLLDPVQGRGRLGRMHGLDVHGGAGDQNMPIASRFSSLISLFRSMRIRICWSVL